MKNLKQILLYNKGYLFLILITFIFCFLIISNDIYYTNYNKSTNTITGIINELKIDGDKLTLTIKGKEKVIVNYYIKSESEKHSISHYQLGDYLKVEGTINKPSHNTNFNLFDYQNYLKSNKIYWIINAEVITKIKDNDSLGYKIKNLFLKRINRLKTSNYVKAFIFGDSDDINSEVLNSYQVNGTSHLLAISGMNITLLASIILYLLSIISSHKKTNYFIVIVVLLFYLFLTNYAPSVLRATLFFILFTINKIGNFNFSTLKILLVIAIGLLLYNPYYIYNVGFKFSFIVCLFLILGSSIINKYNNYIIKTFIISFIAFIAGIPILINNFYVINLLSPIINVVFVPFVSLIIFPLSLIVFLFPVFDNVLLFLINTMESLSLILNNFNCLNIIVCKPNTIIVILYYSLITYIVYHFKIKNIIILFIIIIIHSNINYLNPYLRLTMIDVGQGDSILIEFPYNKKNILIDTGGKMKYKKNDWQKGNNEKFLSDYTVIPYLKSVGVKKIDCLILTHGDVDHMGEAINLTNKFKLKNVIFNNNQYNDLEKKLIDVLEKKNINYYKNVTELSSYKSKILFLNTQNYENENDNSIVTYLNYNNIKLLFMGDAGIETEKYILKKYNISDIDILKVGHHGSDTSSDNVFVNSINPKKCLISVGKNNRYGHPKDSVLKILSKCNIYRTDLNGGIKIKLKKNKYSIRTVIN